MGPNAAAGNHNSDPKNGNGGKSVPYYKTEAYRKLMEARTPPQDKTIPNPKEVPASEAINFLKSMGTGWDADLERLLGVPDKLFYLPGPYLQYCSTDNTDMGAIFQGLRAGGKSFSTGMEYGFMVYDSASATHFLLFDARRRIVVRGIVQEYRGDGRQGWAVIKTAIEVALRRAGASAAAGNGLIAVCDRETGHSSMARLETVH
jgi:hypothetical protein